MAVNLNIKTNSKQVQRKFKRFQSVLPRIIDKGVKQAGFQLIDIIRTKTKKGINFKDGVEYDETGDGTIQVSEREPLHGFRRLTR